MDTATQTHLTQLRSALLYQRAELRAEVHAAQLAKDAGIAAVSTGEQPGSVEARTLAEVEAALRRLDEGVYGDCADCGNPIGLSHLLVLPAARYCGHCQNLHDQPGMGRE